jgi:23S rRNA (adenine2030-N6)-methyltransferase
VNYRHHFHAGNFADVMKHVLMVDLVRRLQQKEKGLLLLDTHAGRGEYDLAAAAQGDSLPRKPEHPEGLGRLHAAAGVGPEIAAYLERVRAFSPAGDRYPGSPQLLAALARPQDRLALFELHPEEFATLQIIMGRRPRWSVQLLDGYTGLKAALPPPERRAFILIDPPFEAADEWEAILAALDEALRRFPSGTFAIWYPLTERPQSARFGDDLVARPGPPAWSGELTVAPAAPGMRGCGLIVLNPPWGFAERGGAVLHELAQLLGRSGAGVGRSRWLRAER